MGKKNNAHPNNNKLPKKKASNAKKWNTTSQLFARPNKKRVKFSEKVIVNFAPDYTRETSPIDSFCCDVCGVTIPAGIRGFEAFASCQHENCDGFDICATCLDLPMSKDGFDPDTPPGKVRVKKHPHVLQLVDPQAEVRWSNNK